jgi:hypothetical protein
MRKILLRETELTKRIHDNIRISIVACLILLAAGGSAFAADVKFEVSLDKDKVAIGELAQLGLSFQGTQSMPAPDIGNIDGLEIRYTGPSTMMTVINGQVSSSITHMYSVMPLKIGKFQIGPFSFTYKGNRYTSNMVFLEASEEKVIARSRQVAPGLTEKFDLEDRLFLTLEVEKMSAYTNELIPVKVKLYVNRMNVSDIQLPTFTQEGFSKVEFKEPAQYKAEMNGFTYEVLEFRTSIFGTRPGEYRLGPAKIKCSLVVRKSMPSPNEFFEDQNTGPYFDDFFTRYERHPLELKSQDVQIVILPLPVEGRPEPFSGAVGDYQFIYDASPTKLKVGDPITVKMTINGTGNFNTVLQPQLDSSDDFKVYEPQVKTEDHSKSFTQVLIPQSDLVTQVPKAAFSYFDPAQKIYRTIAHNAIPIKVEKGKEEAPSQVVGPVSEPEKTGGREDLAKDIIYIKDSYGKWMQRDGAVIDIRLFGIMFAVPLFFISSLFVVRSRKNRLKEDALYASRVAAYKYARRGVKNLKRSLASGDQKVFYEVLFKSVQDYLGAKLRLPSAGLMLGGAEQALSAREVNPDILHKIRELFWICDQAKFALSQIDGVRMKDDIKNFEEIINYLERKKI